MDARKTGFMDQVLGLGALAIPDPVLSEEEGEILSPKSSLI